MNDHTGGGGGGISAGGSAGGDAGHGGSGAAGHAGAGAAGGEAACTKYDDEAPTAIGVTILNKTDAPIYLGQEQMTCSSAPLFQVADARGGALPSVGDCRVSCVGVRTQDQGGCLDICLYPTSIMLLPGELRFDTWAGLYSVPGELPAECVSFQSDSPTVSCDQAKRIQPGTYTFSARAGTALDCGPSSATGTCAPCVPDGLGGCSASGGLISGKILTAQATVELNQSYGVYPSGADVPSPGGNSGSTANLAVQLVFTNP